MFFHDFVARRGLFSTFLRFFHDFVARRGLFSTFLRLFHDFVARRGLFSTFLRLSRVSFKFFVFLFLPFSLFFDVFLPIVLS